ncbi:Fungal Zn(2)-Cys(6) binuclear cluster domain [Geosmithia morbida]|uniref:Fungal Zn(2)-Cys(6) binuclear cluster domain n=1 Tax=Geosmithia morbida TaxID=1094350 RepID=A0A9P4YSP2_9HYPO|nr:Fungal Zn(2)-Cys(6) binuclear cluster domain [Geosmithia morbida]KAF4120941.1 Fungal Zn(2)-Cys(6) binuclear cluster domain [Geosmithia morbida]
MADPDSQTPPPPQSPSQHQTSVHAYASNGLEILQAASDAAQHHAAITSQQTQALQDAAAEAVAHPTTTTTTTSSVDGSPLGVHDAAASVAALAQATAAQQLPHHTSQPTAHHHHHQHILPAPPPSPPIHNGPDGTARGSGGAGGPRDPTVNPKLTRLRRACDMCSMRKVKCDDTTIPCKPCHELGVDCTYNRETKRRGPPNKHAEAAKAAKRGRIEPSHSEFSPGPPMQQQQQQPAQQQQQQHPIPKAVSSTGNGIIPDATAPADAESIAPMPVLELLVDDFFTYIHPLAPFPHEPTFRQSFANREDRTRPEFLGLLASMIAALVASFPRSAREHLKAQHSTHLFPRAIVMIDKCRDIALATRGARWVLKEPKTLDDAATSYFLGLASGYTHRWITSQHFMAETLTLIRELGFSKPKHPGDLPTFGNDPYSPDPLLFNHVKDQIGKRIFWCLLLGIRSFSQLGNSQTDVVIAPSTPSLPYPAYPENTDDIYIVANQINEQAEGSTSLLTGFRFGIDIYTTMNGVVSLELAYGMSTLPWADQRLLLRDGLLAVKSIIDDLPADLQLGQTGPDVDPMEAFEDSTMQYVPPLWPNAQPPHDPRLAFKLQPHRRRQLQYEIQKANIFVSQLATRSYFVELYFDLRDVHLADQHNGDDGMGHQTEENKAAEERDDKDVLALMTNERELIVQNLLAVLGAISQRNLEPNGGSIVNKIRQVASTLLNDAPERKGPLAVKSEEALSQLIQVLVKLEKTGAAGGSPNGNDPATHMTPQDEDEELSHWADLRDYQLRYAAEGEFTGPLL